MEITCEADLKNAIQQLELQKSIEWSLLREQLLITYEGLKPINLVKDAIKDSLSVDFEKDVIGTGLGHLGGYLSKALITGNSLNPLKIVAGNILQFCVSTFISNNSASVKSMIEKAFNLFKVHTPFENPAKENSLDQDVE